MITTHRHIAEHLIAHLWRIANGQANWQTHTRQSHNPYTTEEQKPDTHPASITLHLQPNPTMHLPPLEITLYRTDYTHALYHAPYPQLIALQNHYNENQNTDQRATPRPYPIWVSDGKHYRPNRNRPPSNDLKNIALTIATKATIKTKPEMPGS